MHDIDREVEQAEKLIKENPNERLDLELNELESLRADFVNNGLFEVIKRSYLMGLSVGHDFASQDK